jgi:hypothetical protein
VLQLHLAPHRVLTSEHTIFSAGDCEGHRAADGRYYLLDLSRSMPPEGPATHLAPARQGVFFRLLRPELLQLLKQAGLPALSSDSLSNWGKVRYLHVL